MKSTTRKASADSLNHQLNENTYCWLKKSQLLVGNFMLHLCKSQIYCSKVLPVPMYNVL